MTLRTTLPKHKTCEICRAEFTSHDGFVTWCGFDCGAVLATAKLGKAKRKAEIAAKVAAVKDKRETKAKLEKLKSRATWAKEAQTAFNAWIRLRDADQPCISCGRHHQGQYHAGHFLSVGARPELRFERLNVHKQCSACNLHLSGNALLFRKALLVKHGVEVVDWLEGPHPLLHYSNDAYKAIKADYNARARELQKGMV